MVTDGEPGERAMNSQKTFVEKLKLVADDVQVHVHLVHHIRKGESEHDRPNKFDLKGSGAIADLADQIFIRDCPLDRQRPVRSVNRVVCVSP